MNATGEYEFKEYRDDQDDVEVIRLMAITTVQWSRSFGRCNLQHFNKSGEIYTRARFKAWLKKYKPFMRADERDAVSLRLPTKVWFL